jgi:hypothetical protein
MMARQKSADVPRRQKDEGPPRPVTIVIALRKLPNGFVIADKKKPRRLTRFFPVFPEPAGRASRSVPFYGATTVNITGSESEAPPISGVRCDAKLRYTTIEDASLFLSTHLVADVSFDPIPNLQSLVALTVTAKPAFPLCGCN